MKLKRSGEVGGNFVEKSLGLGNCKAKIDRFEIESGTYPTSQKEYIKINLYLESEPVEGGGWPKTRENPDDKYQGASAKVAASNFAFMDSQYGSKEDGANTFIQNVILACEKGDFWDKLVTKIENGELKVTTPEELVNLINKTKAHSYQDVYLNWCIAGSEYVNAKGEVKHSLHVAKYNSKGPRKKAYSLNEEDVQVFNEATHIIKDSRGPVKTVSTFAPVDIDISNLDSQLGDFAPTDLDDLAF